MTVRLVKADLLHGDINLFVDEVWLNDVHHAVVGERQWKLLASRTHSSTTFPSWVKNDEDNDPRQLLRVLWSISSSNERFLL